MKDCDYNEIIKPLLIEENRSPSEVRRHCRLLSRELVEQIRPYVSDELKTLFVFVLRGGMLLYPPFAEAFDDESFYFCFPGTHIHPDFHDYDTVVIVDTVIETGKTVLGVKSMLEEASTVAKKWFIAAVCANKSVREKLSAVFDKTFCLEYLDNVRVTIDAGDYATFGDRERKA